MHRNLVGAIAPRLAIRSVVHDAPLGTPACDAGSVEPESAVEAAFPVPPFRRLHAGVQTAVLAGGGYLLIGPGALACEVGPLGRIASGHRRVVHAGRHVHLFHARLIAPWFTVSVVVDDGANAVIVSKSIFARAELQRMLGEAGFVVEVHKTWIDRGGSVNAPRRRRG